MHVGVTIYRWSREFSESNVPAGRPACKKLETENRRWRLELDLKRLRVISRLNNRPVRVDNPMVRALSGRVCVCAVEQ